MTDASPKWAHLVERVRAGDRSAEGELVALLESRVHCMILVRTRSRETARELTQDVILHMLQALRAGQLRQAESLPAFVHGIARNLVAGHRRSAAQDERLPLPDEDHPAFVSNGVDPDERMTIVREALARLSRSDRDILLMILVDGLSPASIAARLDLKPEVVRQRKSRAIKRVREEVLERTPKRRTRP